VTILYCIVAFLALIGLLAICFILRRFIASVKYILETPKVIEEFICGKKKD